MEEVIPILRVADVARAAAGYRQLGFEQEWEHRFEPHLPVFVSVARGRMRLFLSEHTRDARPDTLLYLRIDDVDQVAEQFGLPLEDTRWAREVELRDPDDNRLRLRTPK